MSYYYLAKNLTLLRQNCNISDSSQADSSPARNDKKITKNIQL